MTDYLIAFNDEWAPDHTVEELREKSKAVKALPRDRLTPHGRPRPDRGTLGARSLLDGLIGAKASPAHQASADVRADHR